MFKTQLLTTLVFSLTITAISSAAPQPLQYSAKKMVNNNTAETVLLLGKAEVTDGESKLNADKILIDQKGHTLTAEGHCSYEKDHSVTRSEKAVFDTSRDHWQIKN